MAGSVLLIVGLSFAAAMVSGLLWRSGRKGGSLPGCGAQSGCDAVQKSRWARVGRVPVAALGLGVYLLLLVTAIVRLLGAAGEPYTSSMLTIAAIFAGGGAIWFTLLQLVVIHRLCVFCMVLHMLGASACVLALIHLNTSKPMASGVWPIGIGIGGVVALAILQTVLSPKTYATIAAAELAGPSTAESRIPMPSPVQPATRIRPGNPVPGIVRRGVVVACWDEG